MNTNHSQSNLQSFTKSVAYELQDDNLALTLQLWAESLMRVVVFVYVAGVMVGELVRPLGRTLVHPYLTQLGNAFTYKITRSGDVTDVIQEDTVHVEVFN